MSQHSSIQAPKRHQISPAVTNCAIVKITVITTLALAAIAMITVGALAIISRSLPLPYPLHQLSKLPFWATGLMLGGGAIVSSSLIAYGMNQCREDVGQEEKVRAPKAQTAGHNEKSNSSANDKKNPLPRTPLLYAMRLFKNYSEELASSYGSEASLALFLELVKESLPEGLEKEKISKLIDCQRKLEQEPSADVAEEFKALKKLHDNYCASNKTKKTFSHLLHQLLGIGKSDSDLICKKIYKANLLKKILNDYPDWRESASFRAWVASSIVHLKKGQPQNKVAKALKNSWVKALSFLEQLERELLHLDKLPNTLPIYQPLPTLQADRISCTPLVAYPGVQKVEVHWSENASGVQEAPQNYPQFKTKEDLVLLSTWHKYFFATYKQKNLDIDALESELAHFLLQLPRLAYQNELLLSLEQMELTTLCEQIEKISRLSMTLHLIKGRCALDASRLLGLLKALDLVSAAAQRVEDYQFKGKTFPVGGVYHALNDCYFDLGPYQSEIFKTLISIKRRGNGAEIFVPLSSSSLKEASRNLNLIPDCLRSFYCLTVAFAQPHSAFLPNRSFSSSDTIDLFQIVQKELQSGFIKILESRSTIKLDKGFNYLKNFDLKISNILYSSSATVNEIKTITPHQVKIQNPEIRARLVEGAVSNITDYQCDQDGNLSAHKRLADDLSYATKDRMTGLKQTQLKIHQDKFLFPHTQLEQSRALQKMAAGQDNRASNALATFAQYPHLFFQKECGKDYQQTFRLLIFRNSLLIRELEANPKIVNETLKHFDTIFETCKEEKEWQPWAFFYRAHVDLVAILQDHKFETSERLEKHKHYTSQLKERLTNESQDVESHLALLYSDAVLGFDSKELISLGQRLIFAQSAIQQLQTQEPLVGQLLYDFSRKVLPQLVALIEQEGPQIIDTLLILRFKGDKRTWKQVSKGIYQSQSSIVDFNRLQVFQNGKKEGPLPLEIRTNSGLTALFGEELLSKSYEFNYVKTPYGKAWHVALSYKGINYSLYLRSNDKNFPLLFRSSDNQNWQQWLRFESSSLLPKDFTEGFLWSGSEVIIEDASGKKLYRPLIENEKLIKLERFIDHLPNLVLKPESDQLFSKIANKKDFVITEDKDKIPRVTYIHSGLQYLFNEGRWESVQYKGYFLSERAIENWIPQDVHDHSTFFATSYQDYHLLENKEGKAKLILPFAELKRTLLEVEAKYALQVLCQKTGSLLVFDLDKNCGLKSKFPQELLYLSYLLFTQGKYGQALLYLQRSQAIWGAHDPKVKKIRDQIKNWILNWKTDLPNDTAFKLHLLYAEHQLLESSFPNENRLLQIDAELLPPLVELFKQYEGVKEKVDPLLRFTQNIEHLKQRAEAEALQKILDAQIKELKEKLSVKKNGHQPPSITSYIPIPFLDLSAWLETKPLSEAHDKAKIVVEELRELFQGKELADQMGKELAADIEYYAKKEEVSLGLKEGALLEELEKLLVSEESKLQKLEKQLRKAILQQFIQLPLLGSELNNKKLKEQEAIYNELFEEARFCFGTGDFTPLIEKGAIQQAHSLAAAILHYETTRTERQLISRKKESVQRLMAEPQNSNLRDTCALNLQEWRQYDVENHPYAPLLLLLEDELNIAARSTQMKHIHKLIAHPNAYIHEAMAGGKTTFLRNLFGAIESRKGKLAGVVTYAPLMAMHHKEFAEVNSNSFGSKALPFYYHRNAPKDATAIKLMLIHHLKALLENGRVDQTPQAMISLNHTLTELIRQLPKEKEALKKNKEQWQPVIEAIAALQALLRLRSEHLSLYSDEMDKISNPLKDFNYAIGDNLKIAEEHYMPALLLMRLLMEKKSLHQVVTQLKKNPLHLQQMPEQAFERFLIELAESAIETLSLPFPKEMLRDYLIERHQNSKEEQSKMVLFYEETILKHDNPEIVLQTQLLHSFIGVLLRDMKRKVVGTDFGRSSDGIFVKPYSFSATCQETSQRSFVLSTILETCFDYLISGVGEKAVGSYIELMRTEPDFFAKHFGKKPAEVFESDFKEIASKIEGNYELFSHCLQTIIFKNFSYYEEKIEGHAHQIPYLVSHFSGSSGSPERVKTLPHQIAKHPKLMRQKGAIGSVFYSLLKGLNEECDIIAYSQDKSLEQILSVQLEPGDVFIDNAPFFPGKKGDEIVALIAKSTPRLTSFRYLDEQDGPCLWEKGKSHQGEEGIVLDQVVSVIPHKGRQGTNWIFAKGKKGLVEAGVTTELTSFYQSLMRLRLLGKGQTARILYDTALDTKWDKIKSKSILTKIIWALIDNEANLVKQLHFQANLKQIKAFRMEALDRIKREVSVEDLIEIKKVEEFRLTDKKPLDPVKCGRPILLDMPRKALELQVETEVEVLNKLKEKISNLTISEESRNISCKRIDEQIKLLSAKEFLLFEQELPNKVPLQSLSTDAVEEIEIEVQAEQQQQIEQQVDLETETELSLVQELEHKDSLFKAQFHPQSHEGEERAISAKLLDEAIYFYEKSVYPYWNTFIDEKLFPKIFATHHALGFSNFSLPFDSPLYQGYSLKKTKAAALEHQELRKKQLWLYGNAKEIAMAPQLLFYISHDEQFYCQIGSIKDSDLLFCKMLQEKQWAEEWVDISYEEALLRDPKDFSFHQWDCIQRQKEGQWNYEESAQKMKSLKKTEIFKVSVHSDGMPKPLPQKFHKEWVEKMALAKLLFVEVAKLTKEEECYLSLWLKSCGIPIETLKKRLGAYLKNCCPNHKSNPILQLLERV